MMQFSPKKISALAQCYKLFIGVLCTLFLATANAITLEEVIETALQVDPSVTASKHVQLGTVETVTIARSRLLPQVALQGSSSQLTQTTSQDLVTGVSSSKSFTGPSVNHQFSIRQALIRPKELSAIRHAELQSQYIDLKYKNDVSDLKIKVANAWIELLGAQQIAKAYETLLPFMAATVSQERSKYEQGDSTKDVFLEVEAQYVNVKATYIQAVETLSAKQGSFEKLTTVPAINLVNNKLDLVPTSFIHEDEKHIVWEQVRINSLDLQMTQLQEIMQIERIKNAEADHKPSLDAFMALNLAKNDATSTQGYHYKNKQIGIQYLIPIYAGGSISAAVRQAISLSEASKYESEAINLKIQIEFDNNWSQFVSAQYRLKAYYELLKSMEAQLKATARQFELGMKTISDLATAELSYAKRLNDLILTAQDYQKIKYKLRIKL